MRNQMRDLFEMNYAETHDEPLSLVRQARMGETYRDPKKASHWRSFAAGYVIALQVVEQLSGKAPSN